MFTATFILIGLFVFIGKVLDGDTVYGCGIPVLLILFFGVLFGAVAVFEFLTMFL